MLGPEEGLFGSCEDETEMTCQCILCFLNSCRSCFAALWSCLCKWFRPRHEDETQHHVCDQCKENEVKLREAEENERKLKEELRIGHLENLEKQKTIQRLFEQISDLKEKLRYRRVVSAAYDGVEDMNSPFSNAKLADKFHTIKDIEWRNLFKATEKLTNGNEIGAIQKISAFAEAEQRQYILKEENRHIAKENIIERISKVDGPPGFTDALRRFLRVYIDVCLLMITSQPPIFLEFDVVGQQLKGELTERFSSYCPQDTVKREEDVDTIVEVVWPELNDRFGVHKKGLVVIVDEKIEDNPGDNMNGVEKHTAVQHSVQNTTQSGLDNIGFQTDI